MRLEERLFALGVTLYRVIRQILTPGGRLFIFGWLLESLGSLRWARKAYVASLNFAERSRRRAVFMIVQWRQFHVERIFHRLGAPRVDDPLFACDISPLEDPEDPENESRVGSAGYYRLAWGYSGLQIDVYAKRTAAQPIRILVNGEVVRALGARKYPLLPGVLSFMIKRPVIAALPRASVLEVGAADGTPLRSRGHSRMALTIPHGTGELRNALLNGGGVDKKGCFIPSMAEVEEAQDEYLEIYAAARDAFDEVLGRKLFLTYGTLLGLVREGDFIPGDDDFDTGFFSTASTAEEVKAEAKDMVVQLVRAGFIVSFNRAGRLFRLRRPGDPPELHLDVNPLWYGQGRVWAHLRARLRLVPEDFVPAKTAMFRDTRVYLPHRPERFLEAYYGPGWRVPDPSYSNRRSILPATVQRYLDRTCVNGADFRDMVARIDAEGDGSGGRLISIGSHPLYPLEDYERNCEWSV